jgi:hypothetical protein
MTIARTTDRLDDPKDPVIDTPGPGDFLGNCLVGECRFDAELLLPKSTYFGLPKAASYVYGTWRDAEGNLLRALRGLEHDSSEFVFAFEALPDRQLECNPTVNAALYRGPIHISQVANDVTFAASADPGLLTFRHLHERCVWSDGDLLEVTGTQIAPAIQWFNSWPEGGCFSATAKYRSEGRFLGRDVQGFVGHEIHYMPSGRSWMDSPYGLGREICWQQIANEYDDGSIEQATFAIGADGWGFALVHDQDGVFHSSTDVVAEAEILDNGCPSRVTYRFDDQAWTWRLDRQGQRARTIPTAPLGADGTCVREQEQRGVRYSMGNSDWWTDGRAAPLLNRAEAAHLTGSTRGATR